MDLCILIKNGVAVVQPSHKAEQFVRAHGVSADEIHEHRRTPELNVRRAESSTQYLDEEARLDREQCPPIRRTNDWFYIEFRREWVRVASRNSGQQARNRRWSRETLRDDVAA